MGIVNWELAFDLTSKVYTNNPSPTYTVAPDPISLNSAITFDYGPGIYLLRPDGCSLVNTVRATKDYVPQSDGAILHRRFLGGMEMTLAIQMWQNHDKVACDELLQQMVDTLNGYFYGLLNSVDNDGRISWSVPGHAARMLDDLRLLTYPVESQAAGGPFEMTVTVDTVWPSAVDLTASTANLTDSIVTVTNYGNRPAYPVFTLYSTNAVPLNGLTIGIINNTTGDTFYFDFSLPGSPTFVNGDWVEINTFRNTAYKNSVFDNCKPAIQVAWSEFFTLLPGNTDLFLDVAGATGKVEWNNSWE